MPVAKASAAELNEWNRKLESLGLTETAGEDPHVLKYGFTTEQLEDLPAIDPLTHATSVEENLKELNRQRNASRTNRRAVARSSKAALRDRIWQRK